MTVSTRILTALLVSVLVMLMFIANDVHAISALPFCHPRNGITEHQCNGLIRACGKPAPMKWTGRGCLVKTGKKKMRRMQDGGCQCSEYCGYGCEEACNRDRGLCFWNATLNHCMYKAAPTIRGFPIMNCTST